MNGAIIIFPVVPICDPDGKLQGIITNRDLRFETNLNKQIKECMIGEGW